MTEQTGTDLVAGEPTPRAQSHMMAISERSGLVAYATMADVIEAAKLMSQAGFAVRKHFRGNPGACMAVIQQSLRWGMDPYQIANRSYYVNDQLAYESSVIQAVILVNAPIKGRLKHEFTGSGAERRCRVWADLRDEPGEVVEYTSPRFIDIKPKNSPLWQSDPDQQHYYSSARSFCRRHFPEVLLGVLDKEEAEIIDGEYREIEPRQSMNDKLDRIAAPAAERKTRQPRAAAPAPEVKTEDPPHDPDTGEIKDEKPAESAKTKSEGTKAPEPVKAAEPAPVKESIPVTSGKEPRDTVEDERATQQEMASAAGALDPDDDPFAEEPEEEASPLRKMVDGFKVTLDAVKTEEQLENARKKFMKDFKGVANNDPLYIEAANAYKATIARIRGGGESTNAAEKPAEAKPAAQPAASGGSQQSEEDEVELERIMIHELDHPPRGIDTSDLAQVKAYVQGVKAAEKGRAAGAVPAVYDDVERSAWQAGHAYRVANPATAG